MLPKLHQLRNSKKVNSLPPYLAANTSEYRYLRQFGNLVNPVLGVAKCYHCARNRRLIALSETYGLISQDLRFVEVFKEAKTST